MNAREQWVDTTMESLDGAGRAALNPFVREKILQKLHEPVREAEALKFSLVWKFAAIILLLISLNVFTMVYFDSSMGSGQSTTRSVASEYFSYIDHYNL
jgi:hypothetical protein